MRAKTMEEQREKEAGRTQAEGDSGAVAGGRSEIRPIEQKVLNACGVDSLIFEIPLSLARQITFYL